MNSEKLSNFKCNLPSSAIFSENWSSKEAENQFESQR